MFSTNETCYGISVDKPQCRFVQWQILQIFVVRYKIFAFIKCSIYNVVFNICHIFILIYRNLFVLFYLGKITSDLTLLVDAFKFVIHPNTMCKFSLSQNTNIVLLQFQPYCLTKQRQAACMVPKTVRQTKTPIVLFRAKVICNRAYYSSTPYDTDNCIC